MPATETAHGGFLREALHNRRLLGVALIAAIGGFLFGYVTLVPETKDRSLEEIQADLGADTDAALSREREPEAARA